MGDRRRTAHAAAELIRAAGPYRWVGLYDVAPTTITAIAWTGSEAPAFPTFPITQGLNGAAVTARAPIIVQDVAGDSRYLTTFGTTGAEAIFPVAAPGSGRIAGTIDVESERANAFTAKDEEFLRACAEAIAGLWAGSEAGRPILWRRLDVPGHDAATLHQVAGGAELRGMAIFRDERGPTALHYRVRCDAEWRTTEAVIDGWCGARPVELRLRRDHAGGWTLNGVPCPAVAGCADLDLSFTPATNLLPVRRLDLTVGQTAEVRSAWLEWPGGVLGPLVQRYARRSLMEYDYEAELPGAARFVGVLRVEPGGWVVDYAGLWRVEEAVR